MAAPDPEPGPGYPGTAPPWWTDPTKNVESLVASSERRQDDLREMQARYTGQIGEMRETHAQNVTNLRFTYETQLRDVTRRSDERLDNKDQQLRAAETARIDAIRSVDVGAAAILANQVAASAEALRGQVEAARQQTALALAAALEPIQKDIQDLRRAQYEAQGKQGQVVESRDVRGLNLTAISVLLGFLVLALALYAALHH